MAILTTDIIKESLDRLRNAKDKPITLLYTTNQIKQGLQVGFFEDNNGMITYNDYAHGSYTVIDTDTGTTAITKDYI